METTNYSTQCLQNWKDLQKKYGHVIDLPPYYTGIATELTKAPKFMLPGNGELMENITSVIRMVGNFHLPYPCVALEYNLKTKNEKRIVLVWDLAVGVPKFLGNLQLLNNADGLLETIDTQNSFLIQSISFDEVESEWVPIGGLMVIPMDEAIEFNSNFPPTEVEIELGLKSSGPGITFSSQVYTYHYEGNKTLQKVSLDQLFNGVQIATSFDVVAVLNFVAVTGCGNISSDIIKPPSFINKKRVAKGKVPFFETRVLMVGSDAYQTTGKREHQGGTHARPATHLRRGHIRRLESRNVWVNASVVNAHASMSSEPVPEYRLTNK